MEDLASQPDLELKYHTHNGVDSPPIDKVANDIVIDKLLPSQTGNSGKFLTTNGNIASWGLVNKFGGDGSDGALSIISGTTTLSFTSNEHLKVKNYSSISITGTGVLAFSNSDQLTHGGIVWLRCSGDVTLTSSAAPMIDCSGIGAKRGLGGATSSDGNIGNNGFNLLGGVTLGGNFGLAAVNGGANTIAQLNILLQAWALYGRYFRIFTGAGGGGGGGSTAATAVTGGDGGNGGGGLVIECAGALNFTTASGISVAGNVGSQGTDGIAANFAGGGGGGGGSGGCCLILYNTLTANSGTITKNGGNGGRGGNGLSQVGGIAGSGGNGSLSGNGVGAQGGAANAVGAGGGGGGGGSDNSLNDGTAGQAGGSGGGTGIAGGGGGGGASGYSLVTKNNYFV